MLLVSLLSLLSLLAAPAASAPVPAPADSAGLMRRGVSHELATLRAAQIRDVRYDLALDVTGRDTARGRVTVRFTRLRPGDLIIDFRGPALGDARANGRPLAPARWNRAHLRIPAAALTDGENRLDFEFAALIAPAGASVIRFHDVTDGADYLYTLLVPADANALFPCFDQPDLKAKVTLALTTPRGWRALANGEPSRVRESETKTHYFRETEPISTYLIAFAAGPWTQVAPTNRSQAGRPMTLWVRASRAKEVESDSLFAIHGRALSWLERYFDRPYPFGKFDFLLAPAFPFGGMEHPGAIFYNEESFIYRERPTLSQRLGRTATVYHEVAHQWFGDLVTMRWFDDLWLKEGFATYMAAKMQAALDSTSDAWKTFYLRNKPVAYGTDATLGTTPVWQSLANLDQAKSNYGPIVYNKAPGVLKQLNYLVGEDAFRAGLRAYLARHAYANATWRDLLGAVGESAHRDLTEWGRQYILRPGMPVIEQVAPETQHRPCPAVADDDGRAGSDRCLDGIALRQHPAQTLSGAGDWPVRLEVIFGLDAEGAAGAADAPPLRFVRVPTSLRAGLTLVPLPADSEAGARFAFANSGDYAYGLVMLDPVSTRWVERHVGEIDDDFLRAMLWGTMWDLVRAARLAPTRYLAMAMRELPNERDEQITPSILGRVTRAVEAYLSDAQRDSVLPSLERTLAAVADDPARPYGIRKAHLDALIAVAGTPATLEALDARLDSAEAAGAPLRAPTRWAIVTALVERGAPTAARRLAEETRRDSTTEGRRRAFVAGAARPSAATKAEYFRRYFADRDLNEDWATASVGAFNSPRQSALTLPYLVPALDSLPWIQSNRRIFYLGSWLGAFLGGQRSADALARVDRFLAAHPSLPRDLRQKILQSADELRRTVAIRRKYGGSAGDVKAATGS